MILLRIREIGIIKVDMNVNDLHLRDDVDRLFTKMIMTERRHAITENCIGSAMTAIESYTNQSNERVIMTDITCNSTDWRTENQRIR